MDCCICGTVRNGELGVLGGIMDLKAEHDAWLKDQNRRVALEKNPCFQAYGVGPLDKSCKDCRHLFLDRLAHQYHSRWTCAFGRDTDKAHHENDWPACGRFEQLV